MADIITRTEEELRAQLHALLAETPFATVGQLRDAIFEGGDFCCYSCHNNWGHPNVEQWQRLDGILFLLDADWRVCE
jgi:hypothetical protein